MTTPTPIDPDAPVYEREVTMGAMTLRATVDDVDGERWGCLALEHVRPDGPQLFARPTLPNWYEIREMADQAITAMEAGDAGKEADAA